MKFCPVPTLSCLVASLRSVRNLVASVFLLVLGLSSVAVQAQTAHFSYAQSVVAWSYPMGVALDANRTVYIADDANGVVQRYAADGSGGYTQESDLTGLQTPYAVAVDGSGNVYVANTGNSTVLEFSSGCTSASCATTLGGGFSSPYGIAVDGGGNVYVADRNSAVKKITPGCTSAGCVTTLVSGTISPWGIAVDGSGNVYFSDDNSNTVNEIAAGCTSGCATTTLGGGFSGLEGIAVDGSSNVYVADSGGNAVKKIPTGCTSSGCVTTLAGGLVFPRAVAVDRSGNFYIGNNNGAVLKEQIAGANFARVSVGTSATQPLVFTFDTAGTIGTPAVLTEGAANLDFKDAGTGSCTTNGTSHTYNVGDTCTVDVTFTSKYAGPRYGAVVLYNAAGSPIATGYVYGTGVGPQITFLPGTQSVIEHGWSTFGVAIDASGNVYVVDYGNRAVHKYAPGSGGYTQQTDVANGLSGPHCVAVDGGGNVYVADGSANAVHKYAPNGSGGYTQQTDVAIGLSDPVGVAVDGSGRIYVGDSAANAVRKYAPNGSGGYTQQSDVANTGMTSPDGVAVDGSGNVYIGDIGAVHKYAPNGSGGYTQQSDVANSGVGTAVGVAVDASGNIYVAGYSDGAVHKYAPNGSGGYTQQTDVINGLGVAAGVAVDSSGNVYFTDNYNTNLFKKDYADAPSLSFAATTVHSTSSDSPQTVTLVNAGNAALSFPVPGTGNNPSIPANFSLDSTTSGTCPLVGSGSSTAGTLAAGASCTLPVSFAPTALGSISGSLVLTDTNLNAAAPTYTTQSIQLSGTGNPGPAIRFSVSANPVVTAGTPFNITVTALDGYNNTATGYTGTVHFTSGDPAGVLPADSTLTNGMGTFAVTFASSGTHSIFVIDTANPMIQGWAPVSVNAVATTLTPTVTPPSSYFLGATPPTVSVTLTPSSATGITAAAFTAMLDGTTPLTVSNQSTNVFAISGVPTTLGVGSHTILVSFAGTTSYTASSVSIPLTVSPLPTYVVTVLTDPVSGTAANCSNQSLGGAMTDTNCSLRDAIAAANAMPAGAVSTITFLPTLTQNATTANPAVITLSGSYLDLTGSMKILGPGANLLQISGNGQSHVFQIENSSTATLDSMTVTGGNNTGNGGGIVDNGNLTVSRCVVTASTSGNNGGGIWNGGSQVLTVTRSTISNNVALEQSGGYGGGGISTYSAPIVIDNSTIVGNATQGSGIGGGVFSWNTVTLTNSTVTQNSSQRYGGGIDFWGSSTIANTIIAGNIGGDVNVVPYTDNGGNIFNMSGAEAGLSPLGYYGGDTPTVMPLPGSLALGAGIASSSNTTDQRGVSRPTTGSIDSGAVQTNNYTLAFTTEPPAQVTAGSPFTAAVTLSENGAPLSVAGVSIPLSAVINGNTTALPALTTNASGVASSSALTVNSSGTGYTLVSKLPITSSQTVSATSNAFDVVAAATTLTPTVTPSAAYIYGTTPPTVSFAFTPSSATGITASMFAAVLDGKTSLTVTSSGTNNFGLAGIPAGLGAGSHSIQITFAGTSMYGASSVAVPLTVTKAGSKTALSAGSSSIGAGTSVTLTAQVTSATTGTPTGTVSFYDGSTLLGTTSLSNGAASYSTTALTTVTNHTLSATYGGDANFSGSTTATGVSVAVAALDFSFQASGALSATVPQGGTATFSYTIAPTISGVYPGPVNFMVTGPSTGVSYSLSQTAIAANAGQQTITLTVTTAASTAAVRERQLWGIGGTTVALGVLLPIGMLRRGRQLTRSAGRRLLLALLVAAASVAALGLSGCGGGGNRNLPQSYSVTVTATSGSVSHASIVSVLVR